ncbi:hypothetical protein MXD61_15965 [Frankia sp. AgPm24]|uniref:hypothetical protein n=1 Tax=Frankia sp. AgPm24 TaxID=631128 RepID=UPI00200DDD56|nr:hypothetical protein [Frankia sp. AgPm24]MCK9923349.1 hypothetical protein [Frankia sp. AgPm24]
MLSGAFLAGMVAAAINIWLAHRRSQEEGRNRLRTAFAEAFAAYAAYKEFPYAIRRRRADAAPDERVRLSEALREIQARLAYHIAWTTAESETVGAAYADLVQQAREIAGTAMKDAWRAPAATSDTDMVIPTTIINLRSLTSFEESFMKAVGAHLDVRTPWRAG